VVIFPANSMEYLYILPDIENKANLFYMAHATYSAFLHFEQRTAAWSILSIVV
jgi:hypothetical protein